MAASPAITRSSDHKYTYQGITYPSVTNILKVIDKSDVLMAWAAKNTATAAVELLDTLPALLGSVGPEGVVKALTSRSSWKRDEAAQIGSTIHDIADRIVKGEDTGFIAPVVLERATLYAAWWAASGWTLRLSEAYVVSPTMGYAGTFDLLAKDADGRTVLADVKTGRGVYREAALQLTAYGMAELVARPTDERTYALPEADRYVILHVTEKGVREIEVPVGAAERTAWLACIELSRWHESTKGKRL
jgi:hypothetical protein